jgi:hypothetical protein
MKSAEQSRAEANRLVIDHRLGTDPKAQVCKTCKTSWPCKGWEKAQKLYRDAQRLETDRK